MYGGCGNRHAPNNIRNFKRFVKNKATETPYGVHIHRICRAFPITIRYGGDVWWYQTYIHHRGAFSVARFDKLGNAKVFVVSSADNTTIIGEGVKVGTLTVNKGNVRIKDGGEVTTINRGDENSDEKTYVIYEGATVPTITLADNVVLISAAEWGLR